MLFDVKIRRFFEAASRILVASLAIFCVPALAAAQTTEPLKIGYSMSLTGGLGPNGRSALLAQKIWEEDTNAKGGLLGRPVKLIYYDDQTNPATVPGIYTKLLDIDKVDLVIGGYGTNLLAPAMPVAMQRNKVLIGLLGNAVNSAFNYPNYFSMIPTGPDPNLSVTKDFFDVAVRQNPKPKTVAIVAADAEFGLQSTAIKARLGPLLNGWTNYDYWLPVPKMQFAGMDDLMKKYQARAAVEGVDALGYYMVPWAYSQLQVLQQAVVATTSLDDSTLGDYIRANTFTTDVRFGSNGEWARSRMLQVQFQNIKSNDLAQFKDISIQVVVAPTEYESGKLIYPYEKALASNP